MSDQLQIPGIVGEVPDDPRIRQAVENLKKDGDRDAIDAIVPVGIERYGVKLRKVSLMQSAILAKIMAMGDVDEYTQPFVWLFTLGAPLSKVYESLEKGKKEGLSAFLVMVHEWFESSGIPSEISQEVIQAVGETFTLAGKLMPKSAGDGQESEGLKKNPSLGSSS